MRNEYIHYLRKSNNCLRFFFGYYYSNTYALYINGNSGFVGEYLNQSFIGSIISINESIFFYILKILYLIEFLKYILVKLMFSSL